MKRSRIRLALVCTGGGHFEQMMNLRELYEGYSHFWVTSPGQQTRESLSGERAYFLNLAHFSKPWTYLAQIPRCLWLFARERPTRLLSTGSGRVGFVPIILALVCRVKVVHIETFSHVNRLTKLGRFLAGLKYPITSQWPGNCGENVEYIGPILMGKEGAEGGTGAGRHVFVTLGTREEPFPRLLEAVEALVKDGTITERVVVQAGSTGYRSEVMEIFPFQPPAVIDDLIMNASYVITQESAGIGTKCLRANKKMIVMPRDYDRGELPARSDMNEDLHFRLQELGYAFVAQDAAELRSAIGNLPALKVGFPFDNRPAIAKLRALIEAP